MNLRKWIRLSKKKHTHRFLNNNDIKTLKSMYKSVEPLPLKTLFNLKKMASRTAALRTGLETVAKEIRFNLKRQEEMVSSETQLERR